MIEARKRSERYRKKVRAFVHPGQGSRFGSAVDGQVAAERLVKVLGLPPGFQNYYMIFAKELVSIKGKHSGDVGRDEACIAAQRWFSRGLAEAALKDILEHYGFECPDVFPCLWLYRRKITFSGNISPTDLDDFPVRIRLLPANFDFSHANNDGSDLRFMTDTTCPDKGTPLDYEIENWTHGVEANIWVRVPKITGGSNTDFIYMFSGNAAAADAQNSPGVWSNGYVFVSHMFDDPDATSVRDSTKAAYFPDKKAVGEPVEAAGGIYRRQAYDWNDDFINAGNDPSYAITGDLTIEWYGPVANKNANRWLLQKGPPASACYYVYNNWLGSPVFNNRYIICVTDSVGTNRCVTSWYDYNPTCGAITVDPANTKLYNNGGLHRTTGTVSQPRANNTDLFIGNREGFNNAWAGGLDEVRISGVARSADWIQAQYRSMWQSLMSYGPEEGT